MPLGLPTKSRQDTKVEKQRSGAVLPGTKLGTVGRVCHASSTDCKSEITQPRKFSAGQGACAVASKILLMLEK